MSKTKARKPRRANRRRKRPPDLKSRWHEAIIVDYAKLLGRPNVERVGLGWKERKGKITSRYSVKIYVREKRDNKKLAKHERLPTWTNVLVPVAKDRYKSIRVPTDIVWHKEAKFSASPGDYLDPVMSGALVGVPGSSEGTYACKVVNQQGQPFALTAGHTIQAVIGPTPPGRPVVQPPNPPPNVSALLGYTATGFFGNQPNGFVDCALIKLDSRNAVSTALDGVNSNGQVLPWAYVINNKIQVTKFGGITERSGAVIVGRVPSIVIDGIVVTEVYECVGTTGPIFGQPGDSGALILSASPGTQGSIVGILFATAPPTPDAHYGKGYAYPFERIVGFRPA